MPEFTESGVIATVQNLGSFLADLGKMDTAISRIGSASLGGIQTVTSELTNLGSGVLKVGAIAAGAGLAGIGALTAGFVALGVSAAGEYARYERMSLSITNLVARELSMGQQQIQQKSVLSQLTGDEAQKLQDLNLSLQDNVAHRATLTAQMQEQQQRVIDLTARYGEEGLNVQTAKAKLTEMQIELDKNANSSTKLQGEIDKLNSKNGQFVTVLEKVRVGQMSMTDAMVQAAPKAQELLKWISLVAIQSPFDQAGIAMAFQTAMAYGFTTEQAKRLTQAEVDFTAATGKSTTEANNIAYALGQIQSRGKVTAHELHMLATAGIGVNRILEDMGKSLDDVTAGNVDAQKFMEATIKDMEVFTGAGKAQATTFSGLFTTLSEIKSVGLREFFTGTFKAIQPYLADFVGWLSSISVETNTLRNAGDVLGKYVGGGIATIYDLVKQFQRWGPEGIFAAMGFTGSSLFFAQFRYFVSLISGSIPGSINLFDMLGASVKYLQQNAFPMLTKAIAFVTTNFNSFKGALVGIGAVLGTGVFLAIASGILGLLTPINLIIGAAATLGAAWYGNWYGIRDITKNVIDSVTLVLQGGIPYISTIASQYATSFTNWITGLYPQIPGMLTNLTNSIATNLTAGWETIAPALATWPPKFWGWVNQAIAGAGTALGALGVALYTWATSGAGQSSLQNLGQQIGKIIVDWLAISFQNAGPATMAILNLMGTLVAAAAGAAGIAIVIGGTIVAGILSGILQSLGIDVKPATFSELSGILTGIGTNMLTIAEYVGTSIVTGIKNGITSMISSVNTPLLDLGNSAIASIKGALGISSPSTVFYSLGVDTIQGLINGILSMAGSVTSAIGFITSTVTGGMLGGGIGATAAPMVDTATMLANVTLVKQQIDMITTAFNNISLISIPTLTAALSANSAIWTPLLMTFQQQVTVADFALQAIYMVTMPTLGAITMATTSAMIVNMLSTGPSISQITNLVGGLSSTMSALLSTATSTAAGIKQAFLSVDWKSVGEAIGNGIMDGLKSKRNAIKDMAREVAEEALEAAKKTLGISSPSLAFYQVGRMMIQGSIDGIMSLSGKLVDTATNLMNQVISKGTQAASDMAGQLSQYASSFQTPIQTQVTELAKTATDAKDVLTKSLTRLTTALNKDITVDNLKELQDLIAQEPNNALADLIQQAATAQQTLNDATAKQIALHQQLDTVSTQQKQLDFMQKQLSLIDFLNSHGISAAETLKGIKLGVNANAGDLLAATQAALQALLAKMNLDLGKISAGFATGTTGFRVPAGNPNDSFRVGLSSGETIAVAPRGTSMEELMLSKLQALLGNVIPSGMMVPSASTTVNNNNSKTVNYNMTVNTGSSPEAVMQVFQTARAMLG